MAQKLLRLRELSVEFGAGGKLETVTLGRERLDAWPRIEGTCPGNESAPLLERARLFARQADCSRRLVTHVPGPNPEKRIMPCTISIDSVSGPRALDFVTRL